MTEKRALELEESPSAEKKIKLPKKKVALFMSYCGTGYQGMQINPDCKSIEQELHNAFHAAGAVSDDNANDPKKIDFMRAARTDKGVHALGQCVSLKMITEDSDIIQKINRALPEQIRVWGFVRTTNSFHSKNACDSRFYEYLLPTYCLADADPCLYPRSKLAQEMGIQKIIKPLAEMTPEEIEQYYAPLEFPPLESKELETMRNYRISKERCQALRDILEQYVGAKNYHNFTIRKSFHERSSHRYIKSFVVSEPFVRDGCEWLSLKVHGQSFMLHQIRKMVGLAIMMVRTHTPHTLIPLTFTNIRMNISKAPALGLLLERCVYDSYNKKWASNDRSAVSFEPFEQEMTAFKEKWIYSSMIKEEMETNEFANWLRAMDEHAAEFEWYLKADGTLNANDKPPHIMNVGTETE